MNRDYVEMLSALRDAGAEYLVVGVSFDEAWPERASVRIQNIDVAVIGREALIGNKRAVGRPRYLADIAELETP